MAVYRFSASIISRSTGRSATAAAAYRTAERIRDERTGLDHDYSRKGGVEYAEILTPGHAPEWMRERSKLWNAVEMGEKRKDAQLTREVQLSLPHELTQEQRIKLVRDYVQEQFVSRGMVADIAIHGPDRQSDERNHHAHVLLTLREVTREGFGGKRREWNDRELLETWREEWANYQNRALERAGSQERVDHRSYEEQGIDKEPEPKLGPKASEMEKQGRKSERGDLLRKVWERNRQRDELKRQYEAVTKAIEREEAKQREAEKAEAERAKAERAHAEWLRQQEMKEARRKEWQKRRFEEWAGRKRAEQQSRQHDESGELSRRHHRQRVNLEDELKEFYAPGMREAKKILAGIEAREKAGRVNRLIHRLTGQKERDGQARQEAQASLADIKSRMAEAFAKLEARQRSESAEMTASHKREDLNLEERIRSAYERREREGWKDLERQQEAANDRQQQERAGPEPGNGDGSRERGGREFG